MRNKVLLIIGLVLAIVITVGFTPVKQVRPVVRGVDSYNTHRIIFGDNSFSQRIETEKPLHGIGLLLVDIRRTGIPHTISVTILDSETGSVLRIAEMNANILVDDTFASVYFAEPIPPQNKPLLVRVEVPEATINTALGWRYSPDVTQYPRYENGTPTNGAFAFALIQGVPLYESIGYWIRNNTEPISTVGLILLPLILFASLATKIGWGYIPSAKHTFVEWIIIMIVITCSLIPRLSALSDMGGVSGGDPYNYLLISQSIAKAENPFASSKRLPGYPLLLIPAAVNPNIDAHTYMRGLSIMFAAGALVLVYMLTKQLNMPWTARLATIAILAFQKDFFATSLRPEPYALYSMLLLTTLVLFFSKRNPWQQYTFGTVLGYTAMTRQEGFVLAVVLGITMIIQWIHQSLSGSSSFTKVNLKTLSRMFVPATIIVLPFFLSNAFTYGNPLYTPYFEGQKLQIVDSWQAFHDASISTWAIISSMWKPSWDQLELLLPYDHALIPSTIFAALFWWLITQYGTRLFGTHTLRRGTTVMAVIAAVYILSWFFYIAITDEKNLARLTPIIITGFTIISPIPFLARHGIRGTLIAITVTSQILIALWFHPFPKHYQQSYPFIVLVITSTLFIVPTYWRRWTRFLTLSALATPFIMTSYLLYTHLGIFVDSNNAQAAMDSVDYRATRSARKYPAPYLFEQAGLPADVYISRELRVKSFAETRQEFQNALDSTTPNTIIATSRVDYFTPNSEVWQEVETFKSEGKNEVLHTSTVYTRRNDI